MGLAKSLKGPRNGLSISQTLCWVPPPLLMSLLVPNLLNKMVNTLQELEGEQQLLLLEIRS